MNRFLIILLLVHFSAKSFSQSFDIKGTIISSKDKSTLIGASAILLNPGDSALIKGAAADLDGKFLMDNIPKGKYIFKITFLGFNDFYKNITVSDLPIDLGTIPLNESTTTLKEVEVAGKLAPSTQSGDTTSYNAGAFKTNPDATAEDLITKMPGVTSENGKVQAQGEDVKQVLVDGKPFFGDDPNAVLKNLPADVISKIQIFDKKSDQATFTGFDDGNSSKTMNIITKPEFHNGSFGKVFAGDGTDDQFNNNKYKAGGNINFFNGKRRISILGQTNNVNEQNFTTEDLLGVISSGSNRAQSGRGNYQQQRGGSSRGGSSRGGSGGFGGGGDAGNFLVDTKNGISKARSSAGINYVDKWGEKIDVTGSYFFNMSDNTSISNLLRQYVLPSDSGLTYKENNTSVSHNINHRFNLKLEYKLDTMNSILFQPRLSVQNNDGNSNVIGENDLGNALSSSTLNDFSSKLQGINFSSTLLYRHKFLKKGRTLSLNLNPGYNSNKGTSYLNSQSFFVNDTIGGDTVLNQSSILNKKGYTAGSNLVYTEPLGDKSQLQLNYGTAYNKNKSDKETMNYSVISGDYDSKDTALTNTFNSRYFSQQAGASYRMQTKKTELSIGASYQLAELKNEQVFPTTYSFDKTFQSILPNAMLQLKFTQSKNLRIFYRASNNPPSIDQLQNVLNNSNPLLLTIGNDNLKQDFQHNFTARYSSSKVAKSTTFFALLSGSFIDNYIGNSTTIAEHDMTVNNIQLPRGTQLTMPVNLNGYFSVRSFVTYGFPWAKIKSNLNFNLSGSYSRTPGLINNEVNYSGAPSYSFGAVLSSNISTKLDFTLSSTSALNYVENSLQKNLNSNYFNQSSRFKINWIFWKGFLIQTDITHQYNNGLSATYNQNYFLWNAALGYKFLKDQKGDIRFSVSDILKQNQSIQRNTTDTYIEDTQTNVLQRYFMLTFTYSIKQYKKTD